MECKLSKLQKRSTGAKCVALCPTMDLVALLNEDGQLNVHRTLSWDRILAKSIEIGDDAWGMPTSVSFSPSGNLLALGHARGQISVVNMESGDVMKAYDSGHLHSNVANLMSDDSRSIVKIAWVEAPYDYTRDDNPSCSEDDLSLAMISGIGNIHQGLKASLVNASDVSLDTSPQFRLSESAMPGSVLYALGADGRITVYVSGIFPLFAFDERSVEADMKVIKSLYSVPRMRLSDKQPAVLRIEKNLLFSSSKWSVSRLLSQHYDEHVVLLLIRAKANAARLSSMLSACAKRWKDAIRPLSAKIGLLKSALAGYEMNMSPLQFLYSIAQCGLWHPVATMSFATHWNEQGLARTRAAVDTASKSIIQVLHFDVTNCATTVILQCLELLKVVEVKARGRLPSAQGVHAKLIGHAKTLLRVSQHVLLTVDSAAREARRARDSVSLFLQFVREWHYEAQTQEEGTDKVDRPKNAPLQLSPSLYIRLFDPRKIREELSDPGVYAEYIVGTHLTPFFVDAPLPASCARPMEGGADEGEDDNSEHRQRTSPAELVKRLSLLDSQADGEPLQEVGVGLDLSRQSLIQAFRTLNERLDAAQIALSGYVTASADAALKRESRDPLPESAIPMFLQSLGYTEGSCKESIFLPAFTSDRTTSAASLAPRKVRYMATSEMGTQIDLANSTIALYARVTEDAPSGWELALVCVPDGCSDGEEDEDKAYLAILMPSVMVASGEQLSLGLSHIEARLSFKASAAALDPSDSEGPESSSSDAAADALSLVCVAEAMATQVRIGARAKLSVSPGEGESELLLFKVPIEALQWSAISASASSLSDDALAGERQMVECRAGRSLALKSLQSLEISPEKGVAAALDATGRLVVVDLVEDA